MYVMLQMSTKQCAVELMARRLEPPEREDRGESMRSLYVLQTRDRGRDPSGDKWR